MSNGFGNSGGAGVPRRVGVKRWVPATLVVALSWGLIGVDLPAASAATVNYVALGDSYSSGESNPSFDRNSACDRSLATSYGQMFAQRKGFSISNYTCSGAVSDNFDGTGTYSPQNSMKACNPANWKAACLNPIPEPAVQVNRANVNSSQDLITLTLGGNDLGFSSILQSCIIHNAVTLLGGSNCSTDKFQNHFYALLDAEHRTLKNDYSTLRDKVDPPGGNNHVSIVVAGYPHLFAPPVGGCVGDYCSSPRCSTISQQDEAAYNLDVDKFNQVIRDAAADAGVHYVDVENAFGDHGDCATDTAWIRGIIWNHTVYSFHPTDNGQNAYYSAINSFLSRKCPTVTTAGCNQAGFPRNPSPRLTDCNYSDNNPKLCTTAAKARTKSAVDEAVAAGSNLNYGPLTVVSTEPSAGLAAGDAVDLVGSGFAPNTSVAPVVHYVSSAGNQTLTLNAQTADADGFVSIEIILPADLQGPLNSDGQDHLASVDISGTGLGATTRDDVILLDLAAGVAASAEVAPSQPTISCASCNGAGVISGDAAGEGALLSAQSTDGNGDAVTYRFVVIGNWSGFPQVAAGSLTGPSGQQTSWTVPSGILKPGNGYRFIVYPQDSQLPGVASGFGDFTYQQEVAPIQPTISCQSCTASGAIAGDASGDGVTLSAKSTDPNGDDITYTFRLLGNWAGFPEISTGSMTATSGQTASWSVPSGLLQPGSAYRFLVYPQDAQLPGTASGFGDFAYQLESGPGVPVIACDSCNRTGVVPGNAGGDGAVLSGSSVDPNGDDVTYTFRVVGNWTGFPDIVSGSATVPSGTPATWTVPSGYLQAGKAYRYLVYPQDSQLPGTASGFGDFKYQLEAAPAKPVIGCTSCIAGVQTGDSAVLSGNSGDANGDDVTYTFRVLGNWTGFPDIVSGSATAASGTPATWTVPAGYLQAGKAYRYLVYPQDSQLPGTASDFGDFSYLAAPASGVQLRGAPSSDITTGSHNYLRVANPTGATTGDLLVAEVTVTNDSTVAAPSGWTLLSGWPRTDGTQTWSVKQYIFTHAMVAGDVGPYQFNTNGPGGYVASSGLMVAAKGVSTTKPVTSQWAQLASGTSLAVTPPVSTAGSLLLGLSSVTNGFSTSTTTTVSAPLTGIANITEPGRDSAVASASNQSAGQSPSITFTYSQSSQAVATVLQLPAV
jgi:type 1 glutamine amidotransferase/lysophospholipase L1-like esterase